MRLILILVLLLSSIFSHSQMENWYNVDLGTLGFKSNRIGFNKLNSSIPNSKNYYADSSQIQFKGASTELAVDIFTEHVYFHLDGSIVTDLAVTLMLFRKDDWWYQQPYGTYDQTQFLPIRLGFGDNITPYFGLYGGGQWQYSIFKYTPKSVAYDEILTGGNQYGFGLHATFSLGPVLIRQSYMHDWVSRASHFKGKVITHETAVYIGWPILGVFGKMNFYDRTMFAGEFATNPDAIFKGDLKTITRQYEERHMNQFTFSFGIYAAGLFSGVSRGTASAASYIETETKKERDEKKRRTIEYIEN